MHMRTSVGSDDAEPSLTYLCDVDAQLFTAELPCLGLIALLKYSPAGNVPKHQTTSTALHCHALLARPYLQQQQQQKETQGVNLSL